MDRADLPSGYRDLKHLTLRDLLTRYRVEITPKKRSADKEAYRVDRLLRHPLAALRLTHLSPRHFVTFREERLRKVGPQTVRHDLNLLGHVLAVAIAEWSIPIGSNPVSLISKPVPPRSRNRRLQEGELQRIEAAAANDPRRDYLPPLVTMAVETGMRKGELLALKWTDINLSHCLASVREAKNGCPRTVPLSRRAKQALKERERAATESVFPVSVPALRFHWDRLMKRAAIDDLHFHDLRHEAISRFFEKGLSLPEVALISGHRDYKMLFRYTHLRAADLVKKL